MPSTAANTNADRCLVWPLDFQTLHSAKAPYLGLAIVSMDSIQNGVSRQGSHVRYKHGVVPKEEEEGRRKGRREAGIVEPSIKVALWIVFGSQRWLRGNCLNGEAFTMCPVVAEQSWAA